jgi:D-erythrulose 1-phosphate 3-epimerase
MGAVGINLGFVVKRWPEAAQWANVIAGLGLKLVDFSFDLLDPIMTADLGEYDGVRRECENQGIQIASASTGTIAYYQNLLMDPRSGVRARAEEWYRRAIEAGVRLGAKSVGGYFGACSLRQLQDPQDRREAVNELCEAALRLAVFAEQKGVDLVFEVQPVWREYPASMADTEELMALAERHSAPIKLCLDVGHACLPEGSDADRDPYAWIEKFGAHTAMVQLQQTDGVQDRHWPFTDEFNSQGMIDPERIVRMVSQVNPDMDLVFELGFRLDVPPEKVLADVRSSLSYWRPVLEQHGYR